MKNIGNLFVRLFVISLLTFLYFSTIVSLFGAGAALFFTAPAPAPGKPFRRLRLRLRLRPKCVGSGGSGSGSASLKFTFLLRLQSLKICFRSKQFCSIVPQLTCRRWEVSWDMLPGNVLAIAARGRGRRAGQSRHSNVRSVLRLGCGLVGTVTGSAALPTCLIWAWLPGRLSSRGLHGADFQPQFQPTP